MSKYLVFKKGIGEGCDYTIGCNMRYDIVEAKNKEALIEKIIYPDGKDEDSIFDFFESESLSEVGFVEAIHVEWLDLFSLEQDYNDEQYELKMKEQQTKEYETYLKLKEKFEKSKGSV